MTQGLLGIGASALDAAYVALQTTGNNIANVNTPGYSRETTSFTPQIQTSLGGMYIGSGVSVSAVSRVYSDFLGQQSNLAQSAASQADTTAQLTGQINSLFSNTSTGLGNSIDNFFTQLQALSAAPGNAATRQTALSAAQQMAGQFNNYAGQLQTMSQSAQQQIGEQIGTVNTTVAQIASLNDQISLATAGGQSPNSLLDQRNQAILTLNQSIGITTSTQGGNINLYLANGQPLLVGDKTYQMAMGTDPTNPQNIVVGTSSAGAIAPLDPSSSNGGAIGALLQFNNQTIPNVQNQIGLLAVTLSSQMNALQAAGTDQNGATGSKFFSTPAISTSAASTNADAASVSLAASYSDVTQLQASNYQLSVGAGSYTLTRLSDGKQTTFSALPATVDGMTLNFSSAPAAGDLFNISPVQYGAAGISVALSQGAQIAAANPLQARAGAANAGSLAVGNLGLQALPNNPNPKLLQSATLNFSSPTQFTVTSGGATSASMAYTAGQPINYNGWSLTLTGTPAAGDTVSVAATGSGSGDNRNAVLMTQLQGQAIAAGSTLDQAYSGVVASVGATAATAQTEQTAQDAILQSATTAQSAVSGVNLNEEAANLLQYQQQFQAAAQMITTANAIFNSLLTDVSAT
jgi:flagellar hook-associated protein 1 FlgK